MNPEKIPYGSRCYDGKKLCPYWRRVDWKPEPENGYCIFMNFGDWESGGVSRLYLGEKECNEHWAEKHPNMLKRFLRKISRKLKWL